MITCATPNWSDTTVSVDTSGFAGSLLWMANAPVTTSNLTWRFGMPTPPAPVTVTLAVAVPPEQIELTPQAADAGVTVRLLKIGAGLTVTVAVALVPAESWAVIKTAVSARTLAGSSTIVPLVTDAPTGRIAELLDTTKYGGTPPTTVKVAGVLE